MARRRLSGLPGPSAPAGAPDTQAGTSPREPTSGWAPSRSLSSRGSLIPGCSGASGGSCREGSRPSRRASSPSSTPRPGRGDLHEVVEFQQGPHGQQDPAGSTCGTRHRRPGVTPAFTGQVLAGQHGPNGEGVGDRYADLDRPSPRRASPHRPVRGAGPGRNRGRARGRRPLRQGPCTARPWRTAYGRRPSSGQEGPLSMAAPAYVSGYAGSSTGFAGSPPLFSQRSSLAMASETEWATVA